MSEEITINKGRFIRKKIILIVDDNRDQTTLLKFLLRVFNKNFEYYTFNLVDDALDFLKNDKRRENVELILSDFYMYPKNGLEFLQELNNLNVSIPFILYSAFLSNGIIEDALNLGAIKCLNKDGKLKNLVREIEEYVIN
ncbi:MAG: response regulator [Candidatus Hodarchaeales archaeon]|jgi:DNA-binding NtrC family response regulator